MIISHHYQISISLCNIMGKEGLCSLCGVHFKSLNDHMNTIHEKKASIFPCDKCDMRFKSKKYLQHHISQVHEGKIFSCDMCGESYTRSNNLKRHIDSVHKQIKEFQCEYCEGR